MTPTQLVDAVATIKTLADELTPEIYKFENRINRLYKKLKRLNDLPEQFMTPAEILLRRVQKLFTAKVESAQITDDGLLDLRVMTDGKTFRVMYQNVDGNFERIRNRKELVYAN